MLKQLKNLSLVMIAIFSFSCYAADEYDFRKVNWGMNKEAVMATEPSKPYKGNFLFKVPTDALIYNNLKVAGIKASLSYHFKNNSLTSASYTFIENNPPKIYEKLQKLLISKYGIPTEEFNLWKDENIKSSPVSPVEQISQGNLSLQTIWFFKKTKIILDLKKLIDTSPSRIVTEIRYQALHDIKNEVLNYQTVTINSKKSDSDIELTKDL